MSVSNTTKIASSKRNDARLWTPISQALDVYTRSCYDSKPNRYEQLWRLIQLHEAIINVLTVLCVTRVLEKFSDFNEDEKKDCQRLLFKNTSEKLPSLEDFLSPLWGGTDARLSFLKQVGDISSDPFLQEIKVYLTTELEGSPPEIKSAITRVGNISILESGKINVVSLFGAINTLRNKVAHVPLPGDVAKELCSALDADLYQIFNPSVPMDSKLGSKQVVSIDHKYIPSVLKGKIYSLNSVQTGKDHEKGNKEYPYATAQWNEDSWEVAPLILVGDQLKLWVATKINALEDRGSRSLHKGRNGSYLGRAEFHRFAAEHQSVDNKDIYFGDTFDKALQWSENVLEPTDAIPNSDSLDHDSDEIVSDMQIKKGAVVSESTISLYVLRDMAYRAFQSRDLKRADDLFDLLYRRAEEDLDRVAYNQSTSLTHGLVNLTRGKDTSTEEREEVLDKAVKLFSEASGHYQPEVKAKAYYERSKANYHLFKLGTTRKSSPLLDAKRDAGLALEQSDDELYQTWSAFLARQKPEP